LLSAGLFAGHGLFRLPDSAVMRRLDLSGGGGGGSVRTKASSILVCAIVSRGNVEGGALVADRIFRGSAIVAVKAAA